MEAVELYQKRYQFLEKLYLIYPEIQFQAQNKSRWTTYFGMEKYEEYYYYPTIHYRLLPNEIVIELFEVVPRPLSVETTPIVERMLEENRNFGNFNKTVEILEHNEIPFIFGFSGNNSFHIHIYVAPNKGSMDDFVHHPQCVAFTTALYNFILKTLVMEGVLGIDRQVMKLRRIRSFYSQHIKTGNFKIPSSEEIEFWKPPRGIYIVARQMMDKIKQHDIKGDDDEAALKEALKLLESFKKRETSTYIYYTCPFHQPDDDPSFTFNKRKKIFTDWHNKKVYTAKQLVSLLT